MLLQFSCANFRSINEKCTLSLRAKSISDEPRNNVVKLGKNTKVLKTIALYGANSSGKSNFIKAFGAMLFHVLESVKLNDGDRLIFDPFRLLKNNDGPTQFEVVFSVEEIVFRYGFEFNATKIVGEWLYKSTINNKKEEAYFIRTEEGIAVNDTAFPEGVGKEESTLDNRLFLSLCAQLNGPTAKVIISSLRCMSVLSGIDSIGYRGYTQQMLHNHLDGYEKALEFFYQSQLGFNSIGTKEKDISEEIKLGGIPEEMREDLVRQLKGKKSIILYSNHNVYNKEGKIVDSINFDIDEESEGTKKLIEISGPIFDTLANGYVLWIDELDAKMHPLISNHLVKLFESPITNPLNAQLIFSTHDTNLLSSKLLRRDQIWFTEKDASEQTDLYNMMDIELPDGTKPRNDSNYERNYIAGRYGAIPYIQNN